MGDVGLVSWEAARALSGGAVASFGDMVVVGGGAVSSPCEGRFLAAGGRLWRPGGDTAAGRGGGCWEAARVDVAVCNGNVLGRWGDTAERGSSCWHMSEGIIGSPRP